MVVARSNDGFASLNPRPRLLPKRGALRYAFGFRNGRALIAKGGAGMGILTNDMRRVVEEQQLGFVATVCPDGTPNLSPKGTTAVWDDDHLIFADVCSPPTIANLRHNPAIEINVVDTLSRKGFRFKGWPRSSTRARGSTDCSPSIPCGDPPRRSTTSSW